MVDLVEIFTNESGLTGNNDERLFEAMVQEKDQQRGKNEFQRVIRE